MAKHLQLTALSGPVRSLPSRLLPGVEESFNSYMERLSASYDAPLARLITAAGLVRRTGSKTLPGWGVQMSDDHVESFCAATRLDPSAAKSLLLSVHLREVRASLILLSLTSSPSRKLLKMIQTTWHFSGLNRRRCGGPRDSIPPGR